MYKFLNSLKEKLKGILDFFDELDDSEKSKTKMLLIGFVALIFFLSFGVEHVFVCDGNEKYIQNQTVVIRSIPAKKVDVNVE